MEEEKVRQDMCRKLREYRERKHLSIDDASALLKERFGIERSGKSIYAWEKGKTLPKSEIFICLLSIYGVTDISEFICIASDPEYDDQCSKDEICLLENYRKAGLYGKLILDIASMIAGEANTPDHML